MKKKKKRYQIHPDVKTFNRLVKEEDRFSRSYNKKIEKIGKDLYEEFSLEELTFDMHPGNKLGLIDEIHFTKGNRSNKNGTDSITAVIKICLEVNGKCKIKFRYILGGVSSNSTDPVSFDDILLDTRKELFGYVSYMRGFLKFKESNKKKTHLKFRQIG